MVSPRRHFDEGALRWKRFSERMANQAAGLLRALRRSSFLPELTITRPAPAKLCSCRNYLVLIQVRHRGDAPVVRLGRVFVDGTLLAQFEYCPEEYVISDFRVNKLVVKGEIKGMPPALELGGGMANPLIEIR